MTRRGPAADPDLERGETRKVRVPVPERQPLADPPVLGPVAARHGCAVEGCVSPHRSRGLCSRHYHQARYAADPRVAECKRAYAREYGRTRRREAGRS